MIRIVALCVLLAMACPSVYPAMDAAAGSSTVAFSRAQREETPRPGVELLLPGGQIPAIFESDEQSQV
jgi:hypothetical protein